MIDTKWFIVVNTPGVDIRHKFEGQELTLVENVNYQVANQIVREHNAHGEMLHALKGLLADKYLSAEFNNDRMNLSRLAVAVAEGK